MQTMSQQLAGLSYAELQVLNRQIVALMKVRAKSDSKSAAAKFKCGDIVEFNGGKIRGTIVLRITNFSFDETKVMGVQLNMGGSKRAVPGTNWTVQTRNLRPSTFKA